MDSVGICWILLDPVGLSWILLDSVGFRWSPLDSVDVPPLLSVGHSLWGDPLGDPQGNLSGDPPGGPPGDPRGDSPGMVTVTFPLLKGGEDDCNLNAGVPQAFGDVTFQMFRGGPPPELHDF